MNPPRGIIAMWRGNIASIPGDWLLCDGSHGTPDLRDRFIVGAGSTYDVGDTGGAVQHQHGFTGDGHDHFLPGGASISGGVVNDHVTTTDPATGTTDNGTSLPPYYSLAFIMKA